MAAGDHGWRGKGRARIARCDGRLVLRFNGLSTRSGRLQVLIGDLLRKDYRALRPSFDGFSAVIWVKTCGLERRLDVDNVAKVCLDALKGLVWRDDARYGG